ncbi:MAG: DUF4861 family protein, partial [Ferruginibacter sp.]
DAGSQLSRVEATYYFNETVSLPVVAGIIKRKDPGALWLDESNGIMGYWEPVHGKDGVTGVGCIFVDAVKQMMVSKSHLLTITNTKTALPMLYYSGAAWDRAGIITSSQKWFEYLKSFKDRLENPLTVTVEKSL